MLTIRDITGSTANLDKWELAGISDRLWQIGNLEEIKQNISPELFYLHIGINVTGSWQSEGWWGILSEQADLVPYIPVTLEQLRLPELKTAFENVIKIFPEYTVFRSDDPAYYDIVNFLQNASLKVEDERLKCIPPEKRKEMVRQLRKNLDLLEDLTEPVFGAGSESNGWKPVLDFISLNTK